MSEAHPRLAHHFESMEQQEKTITLGMWLFLVTEVMFFGGLFVVYAVYRYQYPDVFLAMSEQMSVGLGTINTGILLASSFSVVLAVHFAKHGQRGAALSSLIATILFAIAFLVIKGFEYHAKYEHGLMIGKLFHYEGPFPEKMHLVMCLYFFMTGLHALHVIIGIGLFAVIAWMTYRGRIHQERFMPVEMSGLYWHFVDLVWVFLFPLFYLIGTL